MRVVLSHRLEFFLRLSGILIATILASGAIAADPFYLGTWKIVSAQVAPWWDTAEKPDAAESKSLVGKLVTVKPAQIIGPGMTACNGPRYKVVNVPAEGLFQGSFDEMHTRNKSVDPNKVAATLGFKGKSWKSLQTGCANELDYHFVDDNTAEFGLNNYIYILKKQP